MSTESLRSVRDHLSEVVVRVEHEHEHEHERVIINRNGREVAVMISPDDLAEIEETVSSSRMPRRSPTSGKRTPRTPPVTWSVVSSLMSVGAVTVVR